MSDIEKHEFVGMHLEKLFHDKREIEFNLHEETEVISFYKNDVLAMAKHFGLIKDEEHN